jgi:hypothetical protein
MKFHLTIIFLLITSFLFAQQNLVPNPSFEEYTTCPNDYMMLPTDWYTCSGTPDYFNACDTTNFAGVPLNWAGYQQAVDGSAYCGFCSFAFTEPPPNCYKEYLGCQLVNPLIIGQKYFVSFKVSSSGGFGNGIATNNIGLLFSTISFQVYDPYSATVFGIPTNNFAHIVDTNVISDSVNWTTIKGSIIADSAYQYLLIGDFFDVQHTDTSVTNSSYLAKSYYYLDEVCVSSDSLTCNTTDAINETNYKENLIKIFPNPATNELTLDFTLTDKCFFELYNLIGAKRKAVTLDCGSQTKNINLTGIDNGLYFYSVVDRNGNRIKTGKLIIIK